MPRLRWSICSTTHLLGQKPDSRYDCVCKDIGTLSRLWLLTVSMLLLVACRGGAAGRAAALPQPQNLGQWLAIAVFVIGIWWVALKIMGR